MLAKFKIPVIVLVCSVFGLWMGSSIFTYFTHNQIPEIVLEGFEKEGCYAGILACKIRSDNSYKISEVNIFLDGKMVELQQEKKLGSKHIEIPLRLDISIFSNGKHELEIEAVDGSYNQNRCREKFAFHVDNVPLKVAFLQQEYKIDQGRTVHVKIQANKSLETAQVKFLENVYDCFPESNYSNIYECYIPVDCEVHPDEYMMEAYFKDFVKNVKNDATLLSKVIVNGVKFPRQRGFVVPAGKLEEEKEISMSNKILEQALEKWLLDSPKKKMWRGPFEIPLNMKRVATPFGEIRTTPEKGRYLHRAVDITDYPKSVVWASQDGMVIIKDRFLESGNSVVIDHGLGVFTLYFHLEDFADIQVGDQVKKGNPIGRMGMTGYANGYHLHWELRVNNTAVDPFQWTQKTF